MRPRQFEQVQHLLAEVRSLPAPALAPLLVAVRSVILLSLPPETSGQRVGPEHQPPAELLPKN
jgi:hypothetical protein